MVGWRPLLNTEFSNFTLSKAIKKQYSNYEVQVSGSYKSAVNKVTASLKFMYGIS
jgi:hypothetical protein